MYAKLMIECNLEFWEREIPREKWDKDLTSKKKMKIRFKFRDNFR
jgi:hypothetical protein